MRPWSAAALLAAACDTSLPGDEVGTYRITKHLIENTCGEQAVHLRDGTSFEAQLRTDGPHAYLRAGGARPLPGAHAEGSFEFAIRSIVARHEQEDAVICRLAQSEQITLSLRDASSEDAAVDPAPADAGTALSGEHTLSIDAVPGDDCSLALKPSGPFTELPCSVRYELEGALID